MKRSRGAVVAVVLIVTLGLVSATAQPASRSAPMQIDRNTHDVLQELEAAAPPSATSKRSDVSGTSALGPAKVSWTRLLRLFAPALVTASAAAVAGGVVGVFVLLRAESLTALALPQVVALGAAIGMRFGWPTLPPALIAVICAVVYLAWTRQRGSDVGWNLPSVYIGGLCLSFLVIANHGQDVSDLQNLFTGIDVAVSPSQAFVAVPVLLLAAIVCGVIWRRWLLLAQAPSAAEVAGLRPARWHLLFLLLLATVVLLGTAVLGTVMMLALLFVPAAVALPFGRRIPMTLIASAAVAIVCVGGGFVVSNSLGWPMSQSVGGVAVLILMASLALHRR